MYSFQLSFWIYHQCTLLVHLFVSLFRCHVELAIQGGNQQIFTILLKRLQQDQSSSEFSRFLRNVLYRCMVHDKLEFIQNVLIDEYQFQIFEANNQLVFRHACQSSFRIFKFVLQRYVSCNREESVDDLQTFQECFQACIQQDKLVWVHLFFRCGFYFDNMFEDSLHLAKKHNSLNVYKYLLLIYHQK